MRSGILKRKSFPERQIGHVALDREIEVLTSEALLLLGGNGVHGSLRTIYVLEPLKGCALQDRLEYESGHLQQHSLHQHLPRQGLADCA